MRRSPALRELRFNTTLSAATATTTQISHGTAVASSGHTAPARDSATTARNARSAPWTRAATRIGSGKRAGDSATHRIGAPRRTEGKGDLERDDARGSYRIDDRRQNRITSLTLRSRLDEHHQGDDGGKSTGRRSTPPRSPLMASPQ